MITSKKFTTAIDLAKFLRGAEVTSGTTTTLSGTTLTNSGVNFTTLGVAVGDAVYISGESTDTTVTVVGSTTVTMDDSATQTGTHNYRICTGQIAAAKVLSIAFDSSSSTWSLIYDGLAAF